MAHPGSASTTAASQAERWGSRPEHAVIDHTADGLPGLVQPHPRHDHAGPSRQPRSLPSSWSASTFYRATEPTTGARPTSPEESIE